MEILKCTLALTVLRMFQWFQAVFQLVSIAFLFPARASLSPGTAEQEV